MSQEILSESLDVKTKAFAETILRRTATFLVEFRRSVERMSLNRPIKISFDLDFLAQQVGLRDWQQVEELLAQKVQPDVESGGTNS